MRYYIKLSVMKQYTAVIKHYKDGDSSGNPENRIKRNKTQMHLASIG